MIDPPWLPAPAEMHLHQWAEHCSSAQIHGPLGCMGARTQTTECLFLQVLLHVQGILAAQNPLREMRITRHFLPDTSSDTLRHHPTHSAHFNVPRPLE